MSVIFVPVLLNMKYKNKTPVTQGFSFIGCCSMFVFWEQVIDKLYKSVL
jgi:hypothetical protein